MSRRYATCECELCNAIILKNEAHYEDVTEETGGWQSNSSGSSSSYGSGYSSNSKGNSRSSSRRSSGSRSGSSSRKYYRHRRVWYCEDCYNDLLEYRQLEEIENQRIRKESSERAKTVFYIFCVIVLLFSVAMYSL